MILTGHHPGRNKTAGEIPLLGKCPVEVKMAQGEVLLPEAMGISWEDHQIG